MKSDSSTGFLSIFLNIIIPVYILNNGTKYGLTPQLALIVALAFPLFGGLYSIIKDKKVNFISLLGLLNILISGTLSILTLGGIWFAVKEALFPLLIGLFVYFSSWGKNPFFQTLFLNPAAFDTKTIQNKLAENNQDADFKKLMKAATQWLSISFLMSAVLNFFLALYIFKPLSDALSTENKQNLINQQLSQMTLYSLIVIMIPSVIFLGAILYFSIQKIKIMTGLKTEELFLKS